MGKGRGRRRVGQVISRDVDCLDRGDRAGLGRGDAFLQRAHFRRQRRLVTHRRRHAAQQRGYFHPGQRVAVDVVDEHQDITAFVAEIFSDGQAGQRNPKAVSRRLIHLTVNQRNLVENVRVLHLVVEVVALAGTLPDPGKHRVAFVLDGDIADQLHHVDGLADTGAAKQTDLAALGERADQVDDLDAGFKQLVRRRLFLETGRLAMDRHALLLPDRAGFVDRVAHHVHDAAQRFLANRHGDRRTGVGDFQTALESVGRSERNRPDHTIAELLLHLEHDLALVDDQGAVDVRYVFTREFNVDHGADNLDNRTLAHLLPRLVPGASSKKLPKPSGFQFPNFQTRKWQPPFTLRHSIRPPRHR